MVSLDRLSVLGKAIMSSAVDAEMLGLVGVRGYLDAAFDMVAGEAAEVRKREVAAAAEALLLESAEVVGGS